MKKIIMECLFLFLTVSLCSSQALALEEPTLEFKKVIGSVYVGKQDIPLYPFFMNEPGPYLSVNFFVVASEDKSELVLIDMPAVLGEMGMPPQYDLLTPFLGKLSEDFPEAEIKAVLLTHDHIDHISGAVQYFMMNNIPVYVGAEELTTAPGEYDFESQTGIPLAYVAQGINPGFILPFDNGVIKAVHLGGHSPGHMGYAFSPDDDRVKINWLFAGDALIAPPEDYDNEMLNITYCFRLEILATDTYSFNDWMSNLEAVQEVLTKRARIFPAHGAIDEGEYWLAPAEYLGYTIQTFFTPDTSPCIPPE
ncbi:MAG: hypothetical protein C0618_11325 [Desulfuromonas sp.]|nr:MAG: hypothetical protein C0618_11325 [Desulfuromonas sp.]